MVLFSYSQPPTLQRCTLSSLTFCFNLKHDEMLLPCDYNFSVSAQWRSDEPQTNPALEDQSLIQTYHHFLSSCMGGICAVRQPVVSCCVVPSHLWAQRSSLIHACFLYSCAPSSWILHLITVCLTGSTCNTGLSPIQLNTFLLRVEQNTGFETERKRERILHSVPCFPPRFFFLPVEL